MRSNKVNYLVVGSFVLAMVAGIVVTVARLSGRTGPTDTYTTSYEDATGLKFGSQVLYMGYPVGQVQEIEPEVVDGKLIFQLELAISRNFKTWRVPKDSIARITAAGLLAAVTIDIRAGDSEKYLQPGDHIKGVSRTDVFAALTDTANTIKRLTETDVKPLLVTLNRSVQIFGRAIEQDGAPLLANLNRLATHLADRAPEVVASFLETSTDIRLTSAKLRSILSAENAEKVGNIVDNVHEASANILRLTQSLRTQLDELLGEASAEKVRVTLGNLAASSEDVRSLTGNARGQLDKVLSDENTGRVNTAIANIEVASADLRGVSGLVAERAPAIVSALEAIATDVQAAAGQMRQLLRPENVQKVDQIVDSVRQAAVNMVSRTEELRGQLDALLGEVTQARVNTFTANLAEASTSVRDLSANAKERVQVILGPENEARIRRALDNLEAASIDVAEAAAQAELQLGRVLRDENVARVDAIVADLNEAAATAKSTVADVKLNLQNLLGPRTAERVDRALDNVSLASTNVAELSRNLNARVGEVLTPETMRKVQKALDNFSLAAANVARLTSDLHATRRSLDKLLADLDAVVLENRPDVRRAVGHLRFILQAVSQHIDTVLQNVEGTSRNMYEFSRQIRNNPGVLLRGSTSPDGAVPLSQ